MCDNVVGERVVCVCEIKFCVNEWCMTKLCVKELCVAMLCVKELCV